MSRRSHETDDSRISAVVGQLGELLEAEVVCVITTNMSHHALGLVCPYARRAQVVEMLNRMDWNDMLVEEG